MAEQPALRSRIAVLGGGAAGLMAALAAAAVWHDLVPRAAVENAICPVLLLEKQERVGRKLLATGNGQCNLSNRNAAAKHYHGSDPRFAAGALHRLTVDDTLQFFRKLGLICRTEADGRIYPYSYQGSSVLDLLRLALGRQGVRTETNCTVTQLERLPDGFVIHAADGRRFTADKVIIATGGLASPALGSDGSGYALMEKLGHHRTGLFPALVQIRTETDLVRSLSGIKFTGTATVKSESGKMQSADGEILFTEYGLSGPPILALSRCVGELTERSPSRPIWMILDLLPEMPMDELLTWLAFRQQIDPEAELSDFLNGLIHKKIGQAVIKRCLNRSLNQPAGSLNAGDRRILAESLKALPLKVLGTRDWSQAQVTAGGISVREFRPDTLESRIQTGLYAAGEVLDIDGDCGGYNLQWAWSSGYLAGTRAMTAALADLEAKTI